MQALVTADLIAGIRANMPREKESGPMKHGMSHKHGKR